MRRGDGKKQQFQLVWNRVLTRHQQATLCPHSSSRRRCSRAAYLSHSAAEDCSRFGCELKVNSLARHGQSRPAEDGGHEVAILGCLLVLQQGQERQGAREVELAKVVSCVKAYPDCQKELVQDLLEIL
mmetsp:Transcript_29695/g.58837  ORF Transcript_29695/g.58837 Transcript_29695/m.58837 type:complete len:128 (-) Transcript_29695:505-888(-)